MSQPKIRWTRYFYCTTLPSLRGTGWPELSTSYEEHCLDPTAMKDLLQTSGKSFGISDVPLTKEIKDGIVSCNLENCKLAGTQSNQRAAAATSWIVYHQGTQFATAHMAWTGRGAQSNNDNTKSLMYIHIYMYVCGYYYYIFIF